MTAHAAPRFVSTAARRSRAAAVSATLRRAGHRPMPSGSTRSGLLQVRAGFDDVTIRIDTSIHPRSVNDRLLNEVTKAMTDRGYRIDRVHSSDEARSVWVYVTRSDWR